MEFDANSGDRPRRQRRDDRPGRPRRHASRGGRNDRRSTRRSGPNSARYRDDRMRLRSEEPDLPEDIDVSVLGKMILQDLKVLSKDNADAVAKHMVVATDLLDDDPQLALQHSRAAKNRAGRVGVVRELHGIVAYRAQEWREALSELRAARRISGGPGLLAVMADCERGLGRPEKAVELSRSEEARQLDPESKVELGIVASGARFDLGQDEAAVATLERLQPSLNNKSETAGRLSYAYADALVRVGRKEEAKQWFQHAADNDSEGTSDALQRLSELG